MTTPLHLSDNQLKWLISTNLLACMLHLALAVLTGSIGNLALEPPVYIVKNTFVFNSSSAGFELVPRLEAAGGFPVTVLTLTFFVVTSAFHLGNVAVWPTLYFDSLEACTTPTRWLEYSLSASLMASIIAFLSGMRDQMMIALTAGLIGTTMTFGFLSELLNRPAAAGDRWESGGSFAKRAVAHFAGYISYIFAWSAILFSFFGGGGACAAPTFVWMVVLGQFILFSSFVVPQLYQLSHPPSDFYKGELGFIALSFVSKAFLGITLLAGGIASDTFDAFDHTDLNETNCDIKDLAKS